MMDDSYSHAAPRRRGLLGPLTLLILAFAAGLALAAFAVHRWDRVAGLLHPAAAVPAAPPIAAPAAGLSPTRLMPAAGDADPTLAGKVDALDARVDAVDARARAASGDADQAAAMLGAFAARRAIDRGQPLGFLETLLRAHFGDREAQAVAMVIGGAREPVTLLQLQNDLATLAPTLIAPGPAETWWTGVRRELGNIFVVRRADTPSREPQEQQARAARALAQGEADVALAEVVRMPGAARAAGWIAEARRYVLVHNALDRLETAALLNPEPAARP